MDAPSVIFVDNHLLALFKPPGYVVQGAESEDVSLLAWAKTWLARRFEKKGNVFLAVVHRLDKPVSGVVLFGRTSKAASRLSEQIRRKEVEKVYLAIVEGDVPVNEGAMVHHLVRQGPAMAVGTPGEGAKEARLGFRVVERRRGRTLVRVHLDTGRRHQIRVQFAERFGPLVGDRMYGSTTTLPGGAVALLSESLTVAHPTKCEPCTFSCEPPQWWPW